MWRRAHQLRKTKREVNQFRFRIRASPKSDKGYLALRRENQRRIESCQSSLWRSLRMSWLFEINWGYWNELEEIQQLQPGLVERSLILEQASSSRISAIFCQFERWPSCSKSICEDLQGVSLGVPGRQPVEKERSERKKIVQSLIDHWPHLCARSIFSIRILKAINGLYRQDG